MNLVYLFKEKATNKIIYVGSSSRPAERMKEHNQVINGYKQSNMKLYDYISENNLTLYKDIEVIWVDSAETREQMYELEEKYYYKYKDTVLNERAGESRNGINNPKRRKVMCTTTNEVFDTVTDCARHFKKGRTTITNVLRGDYEGCLINGKKYHFKYVN